MLSVLNDPAKFSVSNATRARARSFDDVIQHATELGTVLQRSSTANELYALNGLYGLAEMACRIGVHVGIRAETIYPDVEFPAAVRIQPTRRDV